MELTIKSYSCLVRALLIGLVLCLAGRGATAAQAQSGDDFLGQAITLAQEIQRETGVPSSVILAQAILETGWGRKLIVGANNYFGLKASERPDGTVNYGQIAIGWTWAVTQEWDGTAYVDRAERFRIYQTMTDSFHDLGRLYTQNDRYALAMAAVNDPRAFAHRVAEAGFATAPDYADKLVRLMDQSNLYQYDLRSDDARFVGQSDYPTVAPGQAFQIYFDLKNTGLATWRTNAGYVLANLHDSAWGAAAVQPIPSDVAPGETVHWTITLVAPGETGTYRTEWTLQHDGSAFGPGMYIEVTVRAPGQASQGAGSGSTAAILLGIALLSGMLAVYLWRVRARAKL